jgi:hypothetical protein
VLNEAKKHHEKKLQKLAKWTWHETFVVIEFLDYF